MEIRVDKHVGHRLSVLSRHAHPLEARSGERQQRVDLDQEVTLT
jgi:hypothetical protein